MTETSAYEKIIEPNKNWFSIPWKELLHYQDLLFLLVRRDFISKYKQTILGPLWFVIQPVLTALVFLVIFGQAVKIPTDGAPPILFYLSGLLLWSYFARCLSGTSSTFLSNMNLFGKVYFPRLIVPFSVVISELLSFLIQAVTFLGFYFYFLLFASKTGMTPNLNILLIPFFVFHAAALGLGVGLWMSAMTAKYRDFAHLMTFLVQLWMYATPVIYPLSIIPERWKFVIEMNPMTAIVESCRHAFLGTGAMNYGALLFSAVTTVVILVTGLFKFNKAERTFVDIV